MRQNPAMPVRATSPLDHPGARTVLFLTADTGGGHRAATDAIGQALGSRFPGRFAVVECDPLTGPNAHPLVRLVCGWYGPLTRQAPWLWSVVFHLTNTRMTLRILRRLVPRLAVTPIAAAIDRHEPTVMVSAHPLVVDAAVAARRADSNPPSLVTVVTDLATAHGTWWNSRVDRTITPSAALLRAGRKAGAAHVHERPLGIPVREQFRRGGPMPPSDLAALRRSFGLRPGRFVVLVTAGGDGGRGLRAWTKAILRRLPEVDIVAICGRNESLRARLDALPTRGRLRAEGLVDNMPDWLRCVDLVISKAGPSIIAEAASVGVPLLLPTHIPGQEAGNAELAVAAGAARQVRGRRQLVRQIDQIRSDPTTLATLRAAAVRFGKPQAAHRIAGLIAEAAESGNLLDGVPLPQLRKRA